MTEKEARKILSDYREIDPDTGESYGYIIQESDGRYGDAFVFLCKIEGLEYDAPPDLVPVEVHPDGRVYVLPE